MNLDETHDPALQSWVESANAPGHDFPIQNLPYCLFRHGQSAPRVGVRIGGAIFEAPDCTSLNALMSRGRAEWSEMRLKLSRALRAGNPHPPRAMLFPIDECTLLLPVEIGDYTDFFASIFHASNTGAMFRPDHPLLPNYKYVPVAYHGRASSVIVSGTEVRRPRGQSKDAQFGPSRQMDYECELGCFVGAGNRLGEPVPMDRAEDFLFGACLLNDWSARDIQAWEAQPLGPFLGKNFATSISPWIVTFDALAPFRVPRYRRPEGDPAPLAYLDSEADRDSGGIAVTLEVWLSTAKMRETSIAPVRLSRAQFEQMYWTPAQMIAHHTSNGCNLRPGDLLGSGTVSGPEPDSRGCMLELTRRGTEPIRLPNDESRGFLEDGDEVILRGYAEREGARRIGLGECRGRIIG
ncbi:MAG: fumarylacetoacetase [Bryobacteraceae bacterium]